RRAGASAGLCSPLGSPRFGRKAPSPRPDSTSTPITPPGPGTYIRRRGSRTPRRRSPGKNPVNRLPARRPIVQEPFGYPPGHHLAYRRDHLVGVLANVRRGEPQRLPAKGGGAAIPVPVAPLRLR